MVNKRFLIGLLLASVGALLLTAFLTGAPPLPWGLGSSTSEARTAVLEGGSFGPTGEPPGFHAPGGGAPLVSFQGVLTDPATGKPVADGNYSITFRIYDAATVGNNVWTETQGSVPVSGGCSTCSWGR